MSAFKQSILCSFLFLFGLSACGEDVSSSDNDAAVNSFATEARTSVLAVGDLDCPGGGILVETGIDENGNGILDDNEVDSAEKVCNGSAGSDGADGTNGTNGVNGSAGADGQDGVDGTNGANGTNGVDGTNGTNGVNGSNGLPALVNQSAEPAGANCTSGGVRLDVGTDLNNNNLLDALEIESTEFICNNATGSDDGSIDTKAPGIVSAISISNTEVLLQFSKPMQDGVENPSNYSIATLENETSLPVWDAVFANADKSSVILSTFSQTSVDYQLKTANIRDLDGNIIAEPTLNPFALIGPSSTTFVGTDPNSITVADSDGDTLPDHSELIGWNVSITYGNGSTESWHVSSDPGDPTAAQNAATNVAARDTDGDGVTDNEEKHGSMDPRNPDTDGDTLSDDDEWNKVFSDATHQDSDGDGIQDGFEYYTFRTSPILADTDGDQLNDFEEVIAGNRNPLIADVPVPRISVDDIGLFLDTILTITDSEGEQRQIEQSTEASLTRGQNSASSTIDTSSSEHEVTAGFKLSKTVKTETEVTAGVTLTSVSGKASAEVSGEITGGYKYTDGSVFTAEKSSARSAEDSYSDTFTSGEVLNTDTSTQRELVGGKITASVSIDNASNIPFNIRNLEISVRKINPRDRNKFIAVASLLPATPLQTDGVNIGVIGDVARGPFIFTTESDAVYAQQVDELLKSPETLLIDLINYDLVDEDGRNFSWSSQDVLDRTASITFDLGDGRVERYRIATASAHNPANGQPLGITMEYAMSVIGLDRYATIRDGGNGEVETLAVGDDVQSLAPNGNDVTIGDSTEPTTIVIYAGDNGVIDSLPGGDDYLQQSGYATVQSERVDTIRDGGDGLFESIALGDDVLVRPTYPDGSPYPIVNTMIIPGSNNILDSIPANDGDSDDIVVIDSAPHSVLSRYRDVEIDPVTKSFWALIQSTSVQPIDFDKRILRAGDSYDFIYVQDNDFDGLWARQEVVLGSSDERVNTDSCEHFEDDTPCDTLTDREEAIEGWFVDLDNGEGYFTYSNPRAGDSDFDGLYDHAEKACKLDPKSPDSDQDGLSDFEEITGHFKNINFVNSDPGPHIRAPYNTDGGVQLVSHQGNDACDMETGINGYYTNPANRDTDGDGVEDRIELQLGLDPNDRSDGADYLDTDGDGISDGEELRGYLISTQNSNGSFSQRTVTSNPALIDTDGDGLSDLLEARLSSDPTISDTDDDGISDFNEYSTEQQCIHPGNLSKSCTNWTGYISYLNECNAAPILQNCGDAFTGLGTDLNAVDTDGDSLADRSEIFGADIPVNGIIKTVKSDPTKSNSDNDGWNDLIEREKGTDPMKGDTDDDGLPDHIEETHCGNVTRSPECRSPSQEDSIISVNFSKISAGRFPVDGFCELGFYNYKLYVAETFYNDPGDFTLVDFGSAVTQEGDTSSFFIIDNPNKTVDMVVSSGANQGFLTQAKIQFWDGGSTEVVGTSGVEVVPNNIGTTFNGASISQSVGGACDDTSITFSLSWNYKRID